MPFDQGSALFRYWRKYPPAHVLLRAQVGFKPSDEEEELQGQMIDTHLAALAPAVAEVRLPKAS